ncbi:MAG TPA: hypothetical protein VGW11_06505 [Solirubrobacteraceae bacterium]|nr:hypothetical protein [Solirubrobacteraceae bacterium]
MTRVLRAALLILLAGALVAGCGGDAEERNAYVGQVNRAQQAFADTVQELSGQITEESTTDADRKTLRRFESAIDGVVEELRSIEPPEEVATQHRELVQTMDGYGDEVSAAVDALEEDEDPEELLSAQRQLLEATRKVSADINRSIGEINGRLQD